MPYRIQIKTKYKLLFILAILSVMPIFYASRYGNIAVTTPQGDLAEMYISDNASATTINTVNVWEEIDNFVAGETKGCTISGSDITINTDAIYLIVVSISATAAATNKVFQFSASIDNVIQAHVQIERKFATTDVGSMSINGILTLLESEIIKLEVRNITDATNLTIKHANFTMHKL